MANIFFDAHMHAMNLRHPNFVSLVDSIVDNLGEFVTSGALSPGYLLTPANRSQQGLITLMNMFSLFELSIEEIFTLLDDDLTGKYREREKVVKGKTPANLTYPPKSYFRGGKFHFRGHQYDKYGLVPLVMDFSRDLKGEENLAYYTKERENKIISYLNDTLRGIERYNGAHPNGFLEFYPFLGINPTVHPFPFIVTLFEDYLFPNGPFRGVKFYPPLGTDVWPSGDEEREKVTFIYSFCVEHNLPIVTHCDDQGFRGVAPKLAQHYSEPQRWEPVFENYPTLKVDFAHYGRQYNHSPIKALLDRPFTGDPWFLQLMALMERYPNVYGDVSFSGVNPSFYKDLHQYIESHEDQELADKIRRRTLFGTDFSVNLAKVESYSNYLRIFEESPFSDAEVHLFASTNVIEFLGL